MARGTPAGTDQHADTEREFDAAMMEIYDRAGGEIGY